jgi:putative addiction module component (TIGR02574 family)
MQDSFDADKGPQIKSPDGGSKPELTKKLIAELDRRLDAIETDPEDVVTWDEIARHVRRKRSAQHSQ